MKPAALAGLATGVAIPAYVVYRRYRRDLNAARARLDAVDRHVISTRWGVVEYAERGDGNPVLVVHGIFHNCVGGLLSVREFSDHRFIAPSRFGYLGSSMPVDATPEHQADALAALLDALDIDQIDVIGESAGATSALQLALRHPERVKHLAVLVGNLPGSPTAIVQPSAAKLFNRQFPLWVLWTFAPSTMVRLVAGLREPRPHGVRRPRDRHRVRQRPDRLRNEVVPGQRLTRLSACRANRAAEHLAPPPPPANRAEARLAEIAPRGVGNGRLSLFQPSAFILASGQDARGPSETSATA